MDIILASGSPRRRELLASVSLEFSVMAVDVDETPKDNESPTAYIERMVVIKAQAAIAQLSVERNNAGDNKAFIILTADTIGVLPDGQTVLVKPSDYAHACSMWQQMSDNTHEVWTCVQATHVLLTKNKGQGSEIGTTQLDIKLVSLHQIMERTQVTFVPLTQDMMSAYWNTGEPADKAGAYGIQGLAAAWVTRINGSYTNVVGLPLAQTLALIDDIKKLN
ncbi:MULTISPECIES: Maf family protein [unclassified Psychrobacter]|uniref:Maf family protein n=1 Tax=unclassified Psychrobacter TaxID=196806 RepID=UPI003FD38A28